MTAAGSRRQSAAPMRRPPDRAPAGAAARAAQGRCRAGDRSTASALPSSGARVDGSPPSRRRRGMPPQTPLRGGRLTGRLQVAGGHPRLDEDRRRPVVDGVHHAALPATGLPVLAPLGQQPGPTTRALRQAGDPSVPDRTRTVPQGSKLRVGAELPGRSDRAALGQGRAAPTGAA